MPFFRGFFAADYYAGALVLSRLYQLDFDGTRDAWSLVEGVEFQHQVPGTDALPAFLFLASEGYVVIALVGTQTDTQQILNIVGSAQQAFASIPGAVGTYWGSAALNLWGQIQAEVAAWIAGRRVVILGHSLGGAIGEILIPLIRAAHPSAEVACVTYGCPRPGDPFFALAVNAYVTRLEDTDDPVISMPPPVWQGVGSHWPLSGPPPLATYVHPGAAYTVAADGTVTPGSTPLGTLQAAYNMANGLVQSHAILEYARRLRVQLPAEQLTIPVSHYERPDGLDPTLSYLLGDNAMPPATAATPTYYNVRLFYRYGASGPTEEFYTTNAPTDIRALTVPGFLNVRMALAVNKYEFLYARITNPAQPRWVDFVLATDPGITRFGKIAAQIKSAFAGGPGVGDQEALLVRWKLKSGPSARMFVHAFDEQQTDEGTFTPNASWNVAFPAFRSFLQNAGNNILFKFGQPVGLAGRLPITTITPTMPRGAKITPQAATAVTPGTVVYIGGVGRAMAGIGGRKIVQSVAPDNSFFNVGGASPIGTYAGAGAYYYAVGPLYQAIDYGGVEKLTSHRVGRPFDQPVGRKSARLSLRL